MAERNGNERFKIQNEQKVYSNWKIGKEGTLESGSVDAVNEVGE